MEIIKKIKKLLSLATSDNENEAKLASKKAQELLIKHNLTKAEMDAKDPDYETIKTERPRKSQEDKFIEPLLTKYFFVYCYTHYKGPRHTNEFVMIGSPENMEIAQFVYDFLKRSFKNLYKIESKKQGWKGKFRSDYYMGLFQGLREQLESQKKEIDTGNQLMVINDALVKWVKDQNDRIKTTSNKINGRNADARDAGEEAGRNLKISKGISSSTDNGLVLGSGR